MAEVAGKVISERTLGGQINNLEYAIGAAAASIGAPGSAWRPSATAMTGSPITLVVAGETSRGKSSLVNAMLGTPSLLPTGADVTTNVYVSLRAGGPRALVRLEDGSAFETPFADLPRWTTVAGRNVTDPQAVMVEIETPSALLERGLVVVDTPGVGGLDAAHSSATLVALERADALLFVLDAKAPISAPERAFLEAGGRMHRDRHLRRHQDGPVPGLGDRPPADPLVHQHPCAPLRQRTGGAGQQRARRPGRRARGRRLVVRRHGADEGRHRHPALGTRGPSARAGREPAGAEPGPGDRDLDLRLRAHVEATRDAAAGNDEGAASLNAAAARMAELKAAGGTWRSKLFDDLGTMRAKTLQEFSHRMAEIEQDLGQLTDPKQLETFPPTLEDRLAGVLIGVNAKPRAWRCEYCGSPRAARRSMASSSCRPNQGRDPRPAPATSAASEKKRGEAGGVGIGVSWSAGWAGCRLGSIGAGPGRWAIGSGSGSRWASWTQDRVVEDEHCNAERQWTRSGARPSTRCAPESRSSSTCGRRRCARRSSRASKTRLTRS